MTAAWKSKIKVRVPDLRLWAWLSDEIQRKLASENFTQASYLVVKYLIEDIEGYSTESVEIEGRTYKVVTDSDLFKFLLDHNVSIVDLSNYVLEMAKLTVPLEMREVKKRSTTHGK